MRKQVYLFELDSVRNSKAEIETVFYEWLLLELPEKEAESFCETLDKLYWKSKRERQNHFAELSKILREKADKSIKTTAEGGSSDEVQSLFHPRHHPGKGGGGL